MKNIIIILTLLFTTHFFSDLQAQAKIGLVNTTGEDDISGDGNKDVRLRIMHYKSLSKDDCEKEITLTGTLKIIDIPDDSNGSISNISAFQAKKGRTKGGTSNSSGGSPNSFTIGTGKNDENLTHTYTIPPTNGNMLTFDNTDLKSLIQFGEKFYIVITLKDIDRACKKTGIDPIDINPNKNSFKIVKLFVNLKTNKVRVVNSSGKLGMLIGNPFKPFTIQGNPTSKYEKTKVHREIGALKMMFYIKKH
ncbi:MAG: hypothetical protein ACPGVB_06610 [Chitinophagales bacterium]